MARPMRVLHIADSMKLGGVQTLLLSLLPRLAVHGIETRLAVLHGPGPYSALFAARGITPEHLAANRFDLRIPVRLARTIRASAPDLVHAHGAPSCLFAECIRPPRLVEHLHHPRGSGGPLQRLLERGLYRRSDLLLACSQAVGQTAPVRSRVDVLYNGVDPVRFRPPSATERAAARARFGLTPGDFALGMTGRITRAKGQHRVCAVLPELEKECPGLRLLIAGTGPGEAALRDQCARAGLGDRVIFAGFQPDVLPVLQALDAWVLASETEGFPMALLEAMATGLPCLAADLPAIRELVEDGENGLLLAPGARGLAETIADCVASPHRRLEWGTAARDTVLRDYTLDLAAARLAAAYRRLC